MSKIWQIARREFVATVMTKAFLFGLLVLPLMLMLMVLLVPHLLQQKAPHIKGEVAILDASGQVLERARAQLAPQAFAERRRAMQERINTVMPSAMRGLAGGALASDGAARGLDQALGEVPALTVASLPPDADLEKEKAALLEGTADSGGRLALLVVHTNAVSPSPAAGTGASELGSYDLYARKKLDDRLLDELRDAMKVAIVDARLATRNLDARDIRELIRLPYVRPHTIDASGESQTNEVASRLLPMAFMALMLLAVMTAGQQLMTSTIEEKSSRVVELLLAAVSPTQLMAGKVLGQLAVALLMMSLYAGLGLLALLSFAASGLIDPWVLVYFLIFFLIAFLVMASLMAAIGAAVNELREAQALLTPVILVVMLPMMLWLPITRDPNSLFATVMSLAPPVSPFVMMLRLTSSTPPPTWQVWLAILIGVASVYAALWFAGKVFRIGLLMHGKPPNFRTLVKWARMA